MKAVSRPSISRSPRRSRRAAIRWWSRPMPRAAPMRSPLRTPIGGITAGGSGAGSRSETPDTFIQDYFVQLAKGNPGEVAGWVQLNGAGAARAVTVEIPEIGLRQTIQT